MTLPSGMFEPALYFRLVAHAAGCFEAPGGVADQLAAEYILTCDRICGELKATPTTLLPSPADGTSRRPLRVGRAVQPADFWAALVPDTTLVNCISREHFLIEFELENSEVHFQNLSAAGTILNGSLLLHR